MQRYIILRSKVVTFHHSATRLRASGVYTDKEKTMLLCVVNKHQMVDFEMLIAKYPGTFAIEQQVNGVVGNFRRVR